MYKIQNSNQQIQWKNISQVLFKHFIQEWEDIHSKAFIYFKSLKIICEEVIICEFVMKLEDANLQVYGKNFFAYPPLYILPSFSKNASRLLLPKKAFKMCEQNFFPEM